MVEFGNFRIDLESLNILTVHAQTQADANQYTQPTENQTTIRNSSNFVFELLSDSEQARDEY